MPKSHPTKDDWIIEPIGDPSEKWHISEIVVADNKGNRWIVDAHQVLSRYPHLKDLPGVWFNGEWGVV